MGSFRLRDLPLAARLSVSLLMAVLAGGYLASAFHTREHHQNRDQREGLSFTDLLGAYHGVTSRSPLLEALEDDHPGELEGLDPPAGDTKKALIAWLTGDPDQIVPNWDNLDLGDSVPADLMDESCVICHSRHAPEERRAEPFLEYLDDVRAVAFSREISPSDPKVLLASTHTHAIALGTVTVSMVLLLYATAWGAALKAALALLASAGLAIDLAAWWLARDSAGFVSLIVAGGAAHALGMGLAMLAVLAELWRRERS